MKKYEKYEKYIDILVLHSTGLFFCLLLYVEEFFDC